MQSDYYLVEKIIAKKKSGKSVKYLVKWVGFPLEQSTWEPIEHLENVKLLVDEFERSQKENLNLDYNPIKKCENKENEELSDSDDSKSDDSENEEKSEKSDSSTSNGLSLKNSNRSNLSNGQNYNVYKKKNHLGSLKKDKIVELENDGDDCPLMADIEVDEPLRVLDSKMDHKRKVVIYIEWKVRSDGMKPDNSYINSEVLKEKFPKFLIDYYESKIKFLN